MKLEGRFKMMLEGQLEKKIKLKGLLKQKMMLKRLFKKNMKPKRLFKNKLEGLIKWTMNLDKPSNIEYKTKGFVEEDN